MAVNRALQQARLLAAREREILTLRRERDDERIWLAQVQTIVTTLSRASSLQDAYEVLATAILEESPLEIVWLRSAEARLQVGAKLGAEECAQLEALLDGVVPEASKVHHQDQAPIPWALTGRVESSPPIDVLVARTHRTHPYYGGPYDRQQHFFELLLQTARHVLDAIRLREELTVERNSLQQQVALRTLDLERALAEARDARDEARRASGAKSSFVANMSHELRTPLNAIIGYSQLITEAMESGEPPDLRDVRRIEEVGTHLLSLISDILDLSKIEAGRMEFERLPIDLDRLAHQVEVTMLPLLAARRNRFERLVTPLSGIGGDPTRIRQILLNLLGNAAKFTEGGVVRLVVRDHGEDRLLLRVEDTGIGMTEAEIGRVFESYRQADASTARRYGGAGLGLTIAKSLVEAMGGTLWLESRPGEGTRFSVVLPRQLITAR